MYVVVDRNESRTSNGRALFLFVRFLSRHRARVEMKLAHGHRYRRPLIVHPSGRNGTSTIMVIFSSYYVQNIARQKTKNKKTKKNVAVAVRLDARGRSRTKRSAREKRAANLPGRVTATRAVASTEARRRAAA